MEHGGSGLKWASGYNMGGGGLYEVVWMIDTDDLNLGQDHVMWLGGWDEDEGGARPKTDGERMENNLLLK